MSDMRMGARWSWALPSADASAARSSWRTWRSPWVLLLLPVVGGLLFGSILGLGIGVGVGGAPTAQSQVALNADPSLTSQDPAVAGDSFIQAQLLVLDGDDLAATVGSGLGLSTPLEITANQIGTTNVVQLEVRTPAGQDPTRAARDLVDAYRALRRQALAARVDAALAVVDQQLRVTPATASGSSENSRLLALRNSLQLVRDSNLDPVTVVQQPRELASSAVARGLRGAVVGLVLGALAGLVITLALASRGSGSTSRTTSASV